MKYFTNSCAQVLRFHSYICAAALAGTYKQIEVKLEFVKSGAALPLSVQGSFTAADGTVVPVEIDVNESFELKAEANNVFVDKTTDLKSIIKLHLDKVLAGITVADLSAATQTSGAATQTFARTHENVRSIALKRQADPRKRRAETCERQGHRSQASS